MLSLTATYWKRKKVPGRGQVEVERNIRFPLAPTESKRFAHTRLVADERQRQKEIENIYLASVPETDQTRLQEWLKRMKSLEADIRWKVR